MNVIAGNFIRKGRGQEALMLKGILTPALVRKVTARVQGFKTPTELLVQWLQDRRGLNPISVLFISALCPQHKCLLQPIFT